MMNAFLGFLFAVIVVLATMMTIASVEGHLRPKLELRNETQTVSYSRAKPHAAIEEASTLR